MPSKTDNRHFRSTIGPTIKAAKIIREKIKGKPEHLEAMKRCPFWGFYRHFHEGRINLKDTKNTQKGLELILNTFDGKKKVFNISGKEFEATPEQLAVIFGLQRTNGVDKYDLKHPTHEVLAAQVAFRETYLKGATSPKNKDILESLYATADDVTKPDDFVKLLVLWLCTSIFLNSHNGFQLAAKFLNCVFAMDQVSWPDLIHSHLLEALQKVEKPIKELKGCTIFILFWFAEITHFISKIKGEQGKSKPRFARWNAKVLAENITDLGMTSLRQDLPGSFIDPFDEDEQRLITPTEIPPASSERIREKIVRDIESDEDLESSPDRDAEESVEATMSALSSRFALDVTITGSTSTSAHERVEKFEFVDNLEIPKEYKTLYKKISGKYGHMGTRNVIKFNDDLVCTCVTSLLKIISEMKTVRGEELNAELLERWEGNIHYAESFKFNVMWLRKGFSRLQNQWRSSIHIDKEVESQEQVLNAMQVKYDGLCTRKAELETQLSEVTTQIGETGDQISFYRTTIEEKRTQIKKFQTEPVLGMVLN